MSSVSQKFYLIIVNANAALTQSWSVALIHRSKKKIVLKSSISKINDSSFAVNVLIIYAYAIFGLF